MPDWLDDYAKSVGKGLWGGVCEVGRGFFADVGNTYQAILMADAGWRVPGPADIDMAQAAQAEMEQRQVPERAEPTVDLKWS